VTSTGQPWTEPTLWPEDIPANPSHTLAFDEVAMIRDTSGPSSPSAFAWYDPDTRSWRTSQATLVLGSDEFSETWPRSGMTRNGTAYQRRPSAPRTSATAYSLSLHGELQWTPTAKANQDSPSMEARAPGRHLWATPNANDAKNAVARVRHKSKQIMLAEQVHRVQAQDDPIALAGSSGHLNPKWVEWLMGFPAGWTDLEA